MEDKSLKLITLNAWGGRLTEPLMDFVKRYSKDVDIFCFQEMFDTDQKNIDERHTAMGIKGDIFKQVTSVLPEFEGSFAYFDDSPKRMSLAMSIRRSMVPVRTIEDFIVYSPAILKEDGSQLLRLANFNIFRSRSAIKNIRSQTSTIEEIKARKGKVFAIATEGDTHIAKLADHVIYIPKTIEMLSPLLTVVPLQLFAYYAAVMRGQNVDKPRNLAKSVTVE